MVTPAFWHGAAAEPPTTAPAHPEPLRIRLTAIPALVAAERPGDAAALAEEIDRELTAAGEHTMEVVDVREVRGYLAHLLGDHSTAVGWYLHAVRLRAGIQGPAHPDTVQAARRAYSLWRAVPASDARRLGAELLAAVSDIHGPEATVTRRTRERLAALSSE
ncbi:MULTISPECIES: hypothetical protein [unclassified Streptomyces]|uniref:hypothetical protein n=1 Tax=unclassified Streptomyces TaxID=2593676 RepID=UPI001F45F761|nr:MULTISPECIES: hypothetical protein [unclassified Streptomyces]